jgi:hypothetical protein
MTNDTPPRTADTATRPEIWRGSVRLLLWLSAVALLVVPIVRDLPLGTTTRIAILAWLLVGVAVYWLYAGLGYRGLLLLQLALFSAAATVITAKGLLVVAGIEGFGALRWVARILVVIGAFCAAANLGGMLMALIQKPASRTP